MSNNNLIPGYALQVHSGPLFQTYVKITTFCTCFNVILDCRHCVSACNQLYPLGELGRDLWQQNLEEKSGSGTEVHWRLDFSKVTRNFVVTIIWYCKWTAIGGEFDCMGGAHKPKLHIRWWEFESGPVYDAVCVPCSVMASYPQGAAVDSDHSLPICSPKHGLCPKMSHSEDGFCCHEMWCTIGLEVLQILRDLIAFIFKVHAQDCLQLEDEGTTVPWNDETHPLPFVFQEFWEQPMSAMFVQWEGFQLPFI